MRRMTFRDAASEPFRGVPKTTYLYKVRETDELVGVEMCLGEKIARERTGGFLTLPTGEEAQKAFGEELVRDGFRPRRKTVLQHHAQWPMTSSFAGVNPEQIPELRELWRQNGVTGCDVTPEGDIVWDSRHARKRDCEVRGLFDRDGGYGDAQPRYA